MTEEYLRVRAKSHNAFAAAPLSWIFIAGLVVNRGCLWAAEMWRWGVSLDIEVIALTNFGLFFS